MEITPELARRLVATQFPHWAGHAVTRVPEDGHDNRTFRLGDTMLLRMPSAAHYADKVAKEQAWLPRLAPHLPLPIPHPITMGEPSDLYPWPWSVYRWIDGESASHERIDDPVAYARELTAFLNALQQIDTTDGLEPGAHNFWRGGPVSTYDEETRRFAAALRDEVDEATALSVWEAATASTWTRDPVWIHGDVAPSNTLVRDGRLCAVIDFGGMGVGDPACDLTIAWTFFSGPSREAFRAAFDLDEHTWARARGWAIWKAMLLVVEYRDSDEPRANLSRQVIRDVIAEHAACFG